MTWVTDSSDSFNRANGALSGASLDNALGGSSSEVWAEIVGTWSISANKAVETLSGGASDRFLGVDLATAVDDMRVACKTYVNDCGVMARMNGAGTQGYLAYSNWSTGNIQLFKFSSGTFTQLGTDGATISNGDEIAVVCSGTSISAEINGATAVGPITDASYTTGVPGLYGGGSGTSSFDDFVYQTWTAGGASLNLFTAHHLRQLGA